MTAPTSVPPQRPVRLAMLVTHPIQYQAPMIRRLAAMPDVELHVFFQSRFSMTPFKDPGFGEVMQWDVPLVEGYDHTFLPIAYGRDDHIDIWRPVNRGFVATLRKGRFDALWLHGYARPYNVAVGLRARLHGIRLLIRDDVHKGGNRRRPFYELVKKALVGAYRAAGAGYLAVGTLNGRYYEELGAPKDRIFLLPYAVDNGFFRAGAAKAAGEVAALRESLDLEPGAFVILFAGKFMARKRAGDLLAAYRRLLTMIAGEGRPAPYLIYAGSGEKLAETRAAADGLERVRFLGFQGQTELPRLFGLCDVFVMPSAVEPWGLVVNEVMNAGKAVIVTDEAGCGPDLVRPGENGFIYPTGDVEALAQSLATLVRDPALAARMGERSRQIIDGWSFEEDCEGLRLALAKVLPGRRAKP